MTAALAEAPAVAWFVPVIVPSRPPVRPHARPLGRRAVGPRRFGSTIVAAPVGPRVRTRPDPVPAPVPPRLRLTRRGAYVVASAIFAATVLGGVGGPALSRPVGAVAVAQVAPGTPLAAPDGVTVGAAGR